MPPRRRGLVTRQQLPGLAQERGKDGWQATLEGALTETGWTWLHAGPAMLPAGGGEMGWLTPTHPGFPDFLALRAGAPQLVIEVKTDGAYPKPAQRLWLELFHLQPHVLVWVSRPSDPWHDLARWLQRPEEAPAVWGWTPAGVEDALRRVAAQRPRPSRPGFAGGRRATPRSGGRGRTP